MLGSHILLIQHNHNLWSRAMRDRYIDAQRAIHECHECEFEKAWNMYNININKYVYCYKLNWKRCSFKSSWFYYCCYKWLWYVDDCFLLVGFCFEFAFVVMINWSYMCINNCVLLYCTSTTHSFLCVFNETKVRKGERKVHTTYNTSYNIQEVRFIRVHAGSEVVKWKKIQLYRYVSFFFVHLTSYSSIMIGGRC